MLLIKLLKPDNLGFKVEGPKESETVQTVLHFHISAHKYNYVNNLSL